MSVKNTSITLQYVAWNNSTNSGQTGDAANHTLRYVADGVEGTPAAPNITEVDATNLPGVYKATLSASENTGTFMLLGGKSASNNVIIIPVQWTNDDATISSRASQASVDLLRKLAENKMEFVNDGTTTYLVVYDDDGTTVLKKFPFKDSANADITLADVGKLAKRLASVV